MASRLKDQAVSERLRGETAETAPPAPPSSTDRIAQLEGQVAELLSLVPRPAWAPQASPVVPVRPVMDAAERRALAQEDEDDRLRDLHQREGLDQRRSQAQAKVNEAQRELDAAQLAVHDHDVQGGYRERRDARWERLWAGRDPLVEVLVQRCVDEAATLWPPSGVSLPISSAERYRRLGIVSGFAHQGGTRAVDLTDTITNEYHVVRRQRGLRELAETVQRWAKRGECADAADLQARFDVGYAALSPVPTVADLVRKHRGGAPMLGGLPDPPALPPAA